MAKKMFEGDGHTRQATVEDMVPGQVIRRPNGDGGALQSFSDTVVLRETEHGWRVARPYLREHLGGWMTGVEDYEITRKNVPFFHVVLLASGEPHRMTLTPEVK